MLTKPKYQVVLPPKAGSQAAPLCIWTIYSATTFLEECRKKVREKWFEKSG